MPSLPTVDVNLFAFNSVETVGPAIESVLAQTWPNIALTVIDDGSTDGTMDVLAGYAASNPAIRFKRNRYNAGAIANFQRAFWFGDSDYVMPKSGDDLIAPDFVERIMTVLLAFPTCVMCHAGGLVFTGNGEVRGAYPPEHRLHAIDTDLLGRARHVMQHYTSSPSFWGVYRREAVNRLSSIRYRAGWDHVLLAELALIGEIRHVPELLYFRRDGGKPVLRLARAATEQARAGLCPDDVLGDQRWRTPLITTAFAHLEMLATTALLLAERQALMAEIAPIFRARWLPLMLREATCLRAAMPDLLATLQAAAPVAAHWMARALAEVLQACTAILPECDMTTSRTALAAFLTA